MRLCHRSNLSRRSRLEGRQQGTCSRHDHNDGRRRRPNRREQDIADAGNV